MARGQNCCNEAAASPRACKEGVRLGCWAKTCSGRGGTIAEGHVTNGPRPAATSATQKVAQLCFLIVPKITMRFRPFVQAYFCHVVCIFGFTTAPILMLARAPFPNIVPFGDFWSALCAFADRLRDLWGARGLCRSKAQVITKAKPKRQRQRQQVHRNGLAQVRGAGNSLRF